MNAALLASPALRNGVRLSVAAAAAAYLGATFDAAHAYWAMIVAFTIGQFHLGALLRRTTQQVIGTGAGLAVGAGIVSALWGEHLALALTLPVFAFLIDVSIVFSMTWRVFWISVMLVFMLGALGTTPGAVLGERLLSTGLGIAVGLTFALLIFPQRVIGRLRVALADLLAGYRAQLRLARAALLAEGTGDEGGLEAAERLNADVTRRLVLVRDLLDSWRYEALVSRFVTIKAEVTARTLERLHQTLATTVRLASADAGSSAGSSAGRAPLAPELADAVGRATGGAEATLAALEATLRQVAFGSAPSSPPAPDLAVCSDTGSDSGLDSARTERIAVFLDQVTLIAMLADHLSRSIRAYSLTAETPPADDGGR